MNNQDMKHPEWCYGKQKLLKKSGKNDYFGTCSQSCMLKDACISASREEKEFVESQLMTVPFEEDRAPNHDGVADYEKPTCLEVIYNPEFGVDDEEDVGIDYIMDKFNAPASSRAEIIEFIHRVAHMRFDAPKLFDSCMRNIIKGESQAEQARMRGVSRQAVSRGIIAEYAGIIRPDSRIPKELSGLERYVYALCFEDGCSTRSAATVLGVSKGTIYRVGQLIASKIDLNGAVKKNKKYVKKRRTKKQIEMDRLRELERKAAEYDRIEKEKSKAIRKETYSLWKKKKGVRVL